MTENTKIDGLGVARLHFPIRSLGFGNRIGLWLQGCTIHCPGCMSRDTWATAKKRQPVSEIANNIAAWLPSADGLTITGGEPLEQLEPLIDLLQILRPNLSGDIILFTGYEINELPAGSPHVLALIDTLVAGPFKSDAASNIPLLGSSNQTLLFQSKLGRERYQSFRNQAADSPQMDLVFEGNEVWMAGVPRSGDLDHLRREIESKGLSLSTSAGRIGKRR